MEAPSPMLAESDRSNVSLEPGLFDAIAVGVVVHNPGTGVIVAANRAATQMFGANRSEDLIGLLPSRMNSRGGNKPGPLEARLVAAALKGQDRFATTLRSLTGEELHLEVSANTTPIDGRPWLLASWVDVTERNEALRSLHRANKALRSRAMERSAELRFHHRLEELLISLAAKFIGMAADAVDEGINKALQEVGEFAGVDRCFLYQFDPEVAHATLTHEWIADGVPSVRPRMQQVQTTGSEWGLAQLMTGKVVDIPNVDELPEQARSLREMYKELGVRSATNVPLLVGKRLTGFLGLSLVRSTRAWATSESAMLRVFADVLVNTLERQRVERALLASEVRYRTIVDDQTDLVVRWNPEGELTFVNEAACKYFGSSREELLRETIFHRVFVEDQDRVRAKIQAIRVGAPVGIDERRVVGDSGSVAWMQWIDRALAGPDGSIQEFQSVGRDITALKAAQDRVEQRLEFERVLSSVSGELLRCTADQLDPIVERSIGRIAQFAKADRGFVFCVNDQKESVRLTHAWQGSGEVRVAAGTEFPLELQRWLMERVISGEAVEVPSLATLPPQAEGVRACYQAFGIASFLHVPLFARGRFYGTFGLGRNEREGPWRREDIDLLRVAGAVLVSALDRAESEAARVDLEQRVANLGRVATMGATVAGVTHEVSQPLHAAATFAATLKRALNDPEKDAKHAQGLCDRVAEQIERAAVVLRRMREFTRPAQAEVESTDINQAVRQAIEMLAYEARKCGCSIRMELTSADPVVDLDRVQFQQVLINLLQNAYQATLSLADGTREVRVVTRCAKDAIVIEILDNGQDSPGPEEIEKMFEEFFTTKEEGMGIGLSLCRTIASMHAWRLYAAPRPEGGMKFTVELPRSRPGETG